MFWTNYINLLKFIDVGPLKFFDKLISNSQILEEKIHCVTSMAMCQQAMDTFSRRLHAFDGIH